MPFYIKKEGIMINCVNHPEREALSICFGCKKEFCKSCLDEGKEYYYCKNPDCQKLLENELGIINISEIIECPNCKTELELSLDEREKGTMHCPECESFIDFTSGIAEVIEDEDYQEIMTLLNQGDIGIIKSILEDGNVDYYVLGENFLSVQPLLEPVRIYVNVKQIDEAKVLLKNFEQKTFGFSNRQDEDFE